MPSKLFHFYDHVVRGRRATKLDAIIEKARATDCGNIPSLDDFVDHSEPTYLSRILLTWTQKTQLLDAVHVWA